MEFSILGPVEAVDGDGPLPLGGPRQRALLACLLVNANRAVPADRLVEELWTAPPRDAHAALQNQVSRLRKVVGDRLVTKSPGYLLRVDEGELDLDRFRGLVAAAGTTPEPAERSRLLREADSLFSGSPFAEIDAPFAAAEAAALEELRLAALEARIDADLDRGRHAELVPELGTLVARHPLRERLRGQHILALYRSGRQAEALDAYRATRVMLDEQLGLEPSPALRELERAILRHDPTLAAAGEEVPPPTLVIPAPPPNRRRRALAIAVALVALAAAGGVTAALLLRSEPAKQPAVLAPVVTPHRKAHTTAAKPKQLAHRHRAAPRPKRTQPAKTKTVVLVEQKAQAPKRHVVTTAPAPQPAATTTHPAIAPPPPAKKPTTTKAPANVTPTVTTQTVASPPASWQMFSDDFGSSTPNWAMWSTWYDGTGGSYAQQNGRLELTLDANSQLGGQYNMISVSFGSVCRWDGDFDARVDYQLLSWPVPAGARVQLNAWMSQANASADIARGSNQYGETYDGDFTGSWNVYPTDDTKGTLRIARSGGTIVSYYLDHGKWVLLKTDKSNAEVMIGLQLFGDQQDWAHKTVRAAFDNFSIAAPPSSFSCH